jgi:hypothetical protein
LERLDYETPPRPRRASDFAKALTIVGALSVCVSVGTAWQYWGVTGGDVGMSRLAGYMGAAAMALVGLISSLLVRRRERRFGTVMAVVNTVVMIASLVAGS